MPYTVGEKASRRFVMLIRRATRKGWSCRMLAEELGVAFSSVAKWEAGKHKPQPSFVRMLLPTLEGLVG